MKDRHRVTCPLTCPWDDPPAGRRGWFLPALAAIGGASGATAAIPAGMAAAGGMAAGVGTAGAVGSAGILSSLATPLMLAGTVGQTLSQIQQTRGQASALRAEAKSIKYQSQFEERQARRQSQMAIGKQVAMGAASGVDITSGSPLFMELDSVRQGELEALNIRNQGRNAANARKFGAKMETRKIPGQILGGVANLAGASMLSQWVGR